MRRPRSPRERCYQGSLRPCRAPPIAPRSAWSFRKELLLAVGVLELALGDLLESHRQVVLRARLDERRRGVLEAHALTELVVVVVDLAGTLGGDDHERIARVDVLEQLIDAGMDHGSGWYLSCELPPDDLDQLLGRAVDLVVLDHVAELVLEPELPPRQRDPLAYLARALGV